MMFDPFKFWDEMLEIYESTVTKAKDEKVVEYTMYEVDVPVEFEEEFEQMIEDWMKKKGLR